MTRHGVLVIFVTGSGSLPTGDAVPETVG
jgi:hypothetical protein